MTELRCPFDSELWQRLSGFSIGPAEAVLDFTARLARENGWDRDFAERVVTEYKRFLYLAVRAGHVVTPSEEVDQAWHLHLCYTRSYWDELCGEVLKTPVHHGPTAGGLAEGERYEGFYERTLASYEEHFGAAPPADIWPGAEERFAPPAARWVDTSRAWVLPKPTFLRGGRLPTLARLAAWAHSPSPTKSVAVAVGALVITTSCMGSVLDWKGSSFLALYAGLLVVGYFLSTLLENWMRPEGQPFHVDELDPYELAFLGGGAPRTFEAALAVAVRSGAIEAASRSLRRGEVEPAEGWPATVVDAMPQTRSVPAAKLRASLKAKFIRLRSDLQKRGALLGPSQANRLMVISAAPLVAVGLLGISKFFVGIERDRPVGFLAILLGLTVLLIVMRTAGLSRRSGQGNRAWSEAERSASKINKKDLNDQQLPVAVALLGISSLGLSEFARLRQSLRGVKSSSSFGCGTGCAVYSSGGDSGCSGGGSGCGGGGCGGCGGCGG